MKSDHVTMRQVAAEAGVGMMTVSYTYTRPDRVAAPTRERVLEAAARLGYRGPDPVARSLRRGATRNLGVVFAIPGRRVECVRGRAAGVDAHSHHG